jgi:hypothetical protein
VRRGGAKAGSAAQFIKYVLQVIASGEDHSHRNGAQVKQEPEVIEVAVEERIFVVPLDFKGYPVFETVDLMRRAFQAVTVKENFGLELLLNPAASIELTINGFRDFGFSSAAHGQPAFAKAKSTQHFDDVVPFLREIMLEDGAGMLAFVNLVVVSEEGGKQVNSHDGYCSDRPLAARAPHGVWVTP